MQVINDKDSNDNSGKEQTMKQFEDVKLRHQAEVSQLDSSVQALQSEIEMLKSIEHEAGIEFELKINLNQTDCEQKC